MANSYISLVSSLAKSGVAIARLVNIHILENHHAVIIINTSQSLYSRYNIDLDID